MRAGEMPDGVSRGLAEGPWGAERFGSRPSAGAHLDEGPSPAAGVCCALVSPRS